MEKLISLSDFVKIHEYPTTNEEAQSESILIENFYKKVTHYNDFLKKPLSLSMFVPCDEKGSPLMSIEDKEQYFRDSYDGGWWNMFVDYKVQYYKAKQSILFEGFSIKNWAKNTVVNLNTSWNIELFSEKDCYFLIIEDLVSRSPVLTESAKQQLS